ncbi:hypothetical protein J1614_003724 [Plenodomus biglobosus]|nr:hypothetical protein J1614_003724 [Plenodomus biglobosus]
MRKDAAHSKSPPLMISPPLLISLPLAPPEDPKQTLAEVAMIAEQRVPVDEPEDWWCKLLLLPVVDFFSFGIIPTAMACPLEFLVVAVLVLHMNREAKGGLVGWCWQENDEYVGV